MTHPRRESPKQEPLHWQDLSVISLLPSRTLCRRSFRISFIALYNVSCVMAPETCLLMVRLPGRGNADSETYCRGLGNPAKFLPHLKNLRDGEYEIAAGGPNILVFKKTRRTFSKLFLPFLEYSLSSYFGDLSCKVALTQERKC